MITSNDILVLTFFCVQEMTKFFHIYVGAAYIRNGQDIVQNWISRLIDPNADVTTSAPPRADGHTQQAQPLPLVNSHAQPSVGTTSVTLALVNQTASQKRIQVAYPATQEGESHQPTWTVRCCSESFFLYHLHAITACSGWRRKGSRHWKKPENCEGRSS